MTLPSTGPISMMQVRAEVGAAGAVSLGQTSVRNLAGIASGAIGMASLRGKTGAGSSAAFSVTSTDGSASDYSTGTVFTAHAYPSVSVTGGTAPLSYQWAITVQQDSGFTLANANAATCDVAHQIGKYGYIGDCTLSCRISDSGGNTVEKTGIVASFSYEQRDSASLR